MRILKSVLSINLGIVGLGEGALIEIFFLNKICADSIGSSMVRGGGAINMKYKGPPMVAIFFMSSFNRDSGGGAWPPCPPPPQIRSWQSTHCSIHRAVHKKNVN